MRLIQVTEQEFRDIIRDEVSLLFKAMLPSNAQNVIRQPANKKEAADYLGISESTLNTLLKVKAIPSFNIGRQVRFKWSEIEAYVNNKGN